MRLNLYSRHFYWSNSSLAAENVYPVDNYSVITKVPYQIGNGSIIIII